MTQVRRCWTIIEGHNTLIIEDTLAQRTEFFDNIGSIIKYGSDPHINRERFQTDLVDLRDNSCI